MDFAIAGKDGNFIVFSTHQTGADDKSPLQIISADRLAELEKAEASYNAACLSKSNSSVTVALESPIETLAPIPGPMAT